MKKDDAQAKLDEAKRLGKFYTPPSVCELVVALEDGDEVFDPACGAGVLLSYSKARKLFGQDIDATSCELAIENLKGRDVSIYCGDTLIYPHTPRVDCVIANPPFSLKWNAPKYWRYGIKPPNRAADWAFVQIALWCAPRAVFVMFPGALYRGGRERDIRGELILNRKVATVIQLPPNLFEQTSIATAIVVFKRSNDVLFVDATNLQLEEIPAIVGKRQNVEHVAKLATLEEVKKADFSFSVSSYVAAKDEREPIDIVALEAEIKRLEKSNRAKMRELDALVASIKGNQNGIYHQQSPRLF